VPARHPDGEGRGGRLFKTAYEIVIKPATTHVVDLRWDASTSHAAAGYNVYDRSKVTLLSSAAGASIIGRLRTLTTINLC